MFSYFYRDANVHKINVICMYFLVNIDEIEKSATTALASTQQTGSSKDKGITNQGNAVISF